VRCAVKPSKTSVLRHEERFVPGFDPSSIDEICRLPLTSATRTRIFRTMPTQPKPMLSLAFALFTCSANANPLVYVLNIFT
jgi:hypothetical protein